jgi:hypothetical protein
VDGTTTALTSAGAINEGGGGQIDAGTLTGTAIGPTVLGSASSNNDNLVNVLGDFSSPSGFSFTNNQTLTLASVNGSQYTVNAGTSSFYLSTSNGNIQQVGTSPLYDGSGTFSSTGGIGTASAPIYVVSPHAQYVAMLGIPPAYFNAVNLQRGFIPIIGSFSVNVPGAVLASRVQDSSSHAYGYVDASIVSAHYVPYGIAPPGLRLPGAKEACSPRNSGNCPDKAQ